MTKRKVNYCTDVAVSMYDLEGGIDEVQRNLESVLKRAGEWVNENDSASFDRLYLEWMTKEPLQHLVVFYERDETDKEYAIRLEKEEEMQTAQERRERTILAELSTKYYGTPVPHALS